jgi:predicted nucleotide-binding protein
MSSIDYAGYWTGEFSGTNKGGAAIDLRYEGEKLVGTAKFHEPALGQYEYEAVGAGGDQLSLRLTPFRWSASIQLGELQVIGSIDSDGLLKGRWKSTIGTEGVFQVKRFDAATEAASLPKTNSVFLVHGHDEGAMHAVARFLEQLGVKPVILQEQINRGMTIIEKFEVFADRAGFAVVLMTPDDYGYPVTSDQLKRFRPRQNVVLELGYFAAKLGREKTFVLTKGEIEMPSDVMGLVYEPMDKSEGWKMRLAKELVACGYTIDLNRAIM